MTSIIEQLKNAKSMILSTHTIPDGDGIGSQIGLYWALKKLGKDVRIINVDEIPKKYDFLDPHGVIETISRLKKPIVPVDAGLIFDTNDPELLLNLWPLLETNCGQIIFVDHHPLLDRHPLESKDNLIDTEASSTGQIVFNIIKALQIPIDKQIALPIYTSIVFDTNYFRYIRGSATPHLIAAELLRHDIEPQKVHRHLFGNHTPNKLKFLSHILGLVEYEIEGRLALVKVRKEDMNSLGLEIDETRDVIDMIMNVESIEAAVLFREESTDSFKVSFRSKGIFTVSHLAETLGGGGHHFASGATMKGSYADVKNKIIVAFTHLFSEFEKNSGTLK
jgi:phosphoesterase RecJ-like protein